MDALRSEDLGVTTGGKVPLVTPETEREGVV